MELIKSAELMQAWSRNMLDEAGEEEVQKRGS